MFGIGKKTQNIILEIGLKCPDGFIESFSYNIPSELDDVINFLNDFSEQKGYIIKIRKTSTLEQLAKLKSYK